MKRNYIKYLLLLIGINLFVNSDLFTQSNNLKFSVLQKSNGLASNTINAIVQDSLGFLWIGTDNGLNRFDGKNLKLYNSEVSNKSKLNNNYIWSLTFDKNNNLWIGSDAGINILDLQTDSVFSFEKSLPNAELINANTINRICNDKDGNVWIGTWGGGLFKYSFPENKITLFDSTNSILTNPNIFALLSDNENLLIGTDGNGIYKYNTNSNEFIKIVCADGKLNTSSITDIKKLDEEIYLVSTYRDGIYKIRISGNSGISTKIEDGEFWRLAITDDNIYAGQFSGGLTIFNKQLKKIKEIKAEPNMIGGLRSNYLRSFFLDNSKTFWIGTMVGGLHSLDLNKPKFSILTDKKNKSIDEFIFSINHDDKYQWIGTYGSGLIRRNLKDNSLKYYKSTQGANSLESDLVRKIFIDSRNNMFIGCIFGGLYKYDRNKDNFNRIIVHNNDIEVESIRDICEDEEGNIWVADLGRGIHKINSSNKVIQNITSGSKELPGLTSDYVTNLLLHKNMLIIGTQYGGVSILDLEKNEFKKLTEVDSTWNDVAENSVTKLYKDNRNRLLISTWGGGIFIIDDINKLNSDDYKLSNLKNDSGLNTNIVYEITEDRNQNLWLTTSNGISRISPNGEIKNFGTHDGVLEADFNPGAVDVDEHDNIYLGSTKGINFFNPNEIYQKDFEPNVVITSINVADKITNTNEVLPFLSNIEFPSSSNFFELKYAVLESTNPSLNKFKYKMEGFHADWVEVGNSQSVQFTNLDPGEYTFMVAATNTDGKWSSKTASLDIKILPPFYQTLLFRIIAMVVLAFLVIVVYKQRVNKIREEGKRKEEFSRVLLNSQENDRERIAGELHDSLGQNLIVIKNRAELAIQAKDAELSNEQLSEISELSSTAISEVRSIAYNLHPYQLEKLGLTKAITAMINNAEKSSSIKFTSALDNIDDKISKEKQINLYRIIQESINNILKHSKANSTNIEIKNGTEKIFINIEDNGVGFENSSINKAGIGLKNLSKRADFINGVFSINSTPGKGTKINVEINL